MIQYFIEAIRERVQSLFAPREKDFSDTKPKAIEIEQGGRTGLSEAERAAELRERACPNYPDEDPEEPALVDHSMGLWS